MIKDKKSITICNKWVRSVFLWHKYRKAAENDCDFMQRACSVSNLRRRDCRRFESLPGSRRGRCPHRPGRMHVRNAKPFGEFDASLAGRCGHRPLQGGVSPRPHKKTNCEPGSQFGKEEASLEDKKPKRKLGLRFGKEEAALEDKKHRSAMIRSVKAASDVRMPAQTGCYTARRRSRPAP